MYDIQELLENILEYSALKSTAKETFQINVLETEIENNINNIVIDMVRNNIYLLKEQLSEIFREEIKNEIKEMLEKAANPDHNGV